MRKHERESRKLRWLVFVWVIALTVSSNAHQGESIFRLPPSAFRQLPTSITRKLEVMGCMIPQADKLYSKKPANVIHGEFARRGQVDWAVLCSRNGRSTILLFWGKPTACPNELANENDRDNRLLTTVNEKDLTGYANPPTRDVLQHQAIDDASAGKASTVWYCDNGQWKEVAGAD